MRTGGSCSCDAASEVASSIENDLKRQHDILSNVVLAFLLTALSYTIVSAASNTAQLRTLKDLVDANILAPSTASLTVLLLSK